jgi:hypothetical protein
VKLKALASWIFKCLIKELGINNNTCCVRLQFHIFFKQNSKR